jgi:hypothetical protein
MFKQSIVLASILVTAAIATGCATYGGWQPTVDPYNDRNPAMIQQDTEQCKVLAKQAGNTGQDALVGAGTGALIGAAGGAALGAIAGNAGTGAAIGATVGGIGGATKQGLEGDDQHNVIN